MKEIHFTNAHQQKHFDFFNAFSDPHFNICANVDITLVLDFIKKEQLSFTPVMVYLISKAANSIPAFRQRIRGKKVVEHEWVHPSFAIETKVSDVFSFCPVDYVTDFKAFYENAIHSIQHFQENPTFEDEENRDDFLFLSVIPWISFTGLTHAMNNAKPDSVPRIVWGKYFKVGEKTVMPLSVQAHHAVVDGKHVGQYFQIFEESIRLIQNELD